MRQAQLLSPAAKSPRTGAPKQSVPDRRLSHAGTHPGLFPRIVREFDDAEEPLLYRNR